jgi:hypothetical protein
MMQQAADNKTSSTRQCYVYEGGATLSVIGRKCPQAARVESLHFHVVALHSHFFESFM